MIELVDDSKSFDLPHPSGAVFVMKHWTFGMQEEVDKSCVVQDGKGGFTYLVSLEREIKIRLSLQGWRGVGMNGEEFPCTDENKKKLPVGVILWLIREIDERSGIRMPEEEKKN
jgi:hypothetical protein